MSENQELEKPSVVARPTPGEVATIAGGRDITRGFIPFDLLLPQDEILRRRGYDYKLYEMVLGDDQVMSTLQQRRSAVVSRNLEILPGGTADIDKKAAESLKAQLDALNWDSITDKMLYGPFYGYSVAECLWGVSGSEIILADVKVRNRRRFKFGVDGQPRLITTDRPMGELLPERKFWTFQTGADNDDEPYGRGLAHWLYWPVFFKRNDIRFWLIFLEKFGQPTSVAKYPGNSSEEVKAIALAAAAAVATEAAVALPEGVTIELLEAARSGAADYESLHKVMDAAIAKIVLSQTMTTDDGSSRAQGEVHAGVKKEVIRSDDGLVSGSFMRGPAAWLTEWNYPGAKVPRINRQLEDAPDLDAIAERDNKLWQMGWQRNEQSVLEVYGPGYERRKLQTPPGLLPGDPALSEGEPAFAAPGPKVDGKALIASFTERLAEQVDPEIADMVGKVRAMIEKSGSLEEARDGLIGLYPSLGTKAIGEVMTLAFAAGDLAGRAEAKDG